MPILPALYSTGTCLTAHWEQQAETEQFLLAMEQTCRHLPTARRVGSWIAVTASPGSWGSVLGHSTLLHSTAPTPLTKQRHASGLPLLHLPAFGADRGCGAYLHYHLFAHIHSSLPQTLGTHSRGGGASQQFASKQHAFNHVLSPAQPLGGRAATGLGTGGPGRASGHGAWVPLGDDSTSHGPTLPQPLRTWTADRPHAGLLQCGLFAPTRLLVLGSALPHLGWLTVVCGHGRDIPALRGGCPSPPPSCHRESHHLHTLSTPPKAPPFPPLKRPLTLCFSLPCWCRSMLLLVLAIWQDLHLGGGSAGGPVL